MQLTLWQLIDKKRYYFSELSQLFDLEAVLQTNGVTESDVKEVIKKPFENAPKRKGDEKNEANDANDRINTTNVD